MLGHEFLASLTMWLRHRRVAAVTEMLAERSRGQQRDASDPSCQAN